MAASISDAFFSLLLAFALFVSGVLGEITCERLSSSTCAFAVSSSGLRCVLEKRVRGGGGEEEYACRSSAVQATGIAGWVEIDECVAVCGLDRETLGISSDFLFEQRFVNRLCSPKCYLRCLNVVDLYLNLAAGEGVFLPNLCAANSQRREMAEIKSSEQPEAACGSEAAVVAAGRKLIALNDYEQVNPPQSEQGRKLAEYGYGYGDAQPPL